MCGRYSLTTAPEAMRTLFDFEGAPNLPPRYNIAPTQTVPTLRAVNPGGRRVLVPTRWGLVPSWAKDLSIGAKMINARSETVTEKPAFRAAFRRRRCLVPADGFYEWQAAESGKKPAWRIAKPDGGPFAMAGLWEQWLGPGQGPDATVETFAILTTTANKALAHIHHRMPVVLPPESYSTWLDRDAEAADLVDLLRPIAADFFTAYRIGPAIGKVQNDDPSVIEPLLDTDGKAAEPRLL